MVGEPFNKRSVPCAFGIKIGLYFHKSTVILRITVDFFMPFYQLYSFFSKTI